MATKNEIEAVARYFFWQEAVDQMRLSPSYDEAPQPERDRLIEKAERILGKATPSETSGPGEKTNG